MPEHLINGQVEMRLKGRVTRFSKSSASGLAITKVGIVSFNSSTRSDSGDDPKENDIVYLEISDPEGALEAVVEAVMWACNGEILEDVLDSPKRQGQLRTKAGFISSMRYQDKTASPFDGEMSEEGQYFWNLQNVARATVLQELDSIPTTELKEMMAHIAGFEAKNPEKAKATLKKSKNATVGRAKLLIFHELESAPPNFSVFP